MRFCTRFGASLAAIFLLLSSYSPATASSILRSYEFVLDPFQRVTLNPFSINMPFPEIRGKVSVAFDASAGASNIPVTVDYLSVSNIAEIRASDFAASDRLVFFTPTNNTAGAFFNNWLVLGIGRATTAPRLTSFEHNNLSPGGYWTGAGYLSVPELGTWTTLPFGFGLLGAALRRSRTIGPPEFRTSEARAA